MSAAATDNAHIVDKMKVADLKRELKSRGLPVTGNKPELVQRLCEYLNMNEEKVLLTGLGSDDLADDSLLEHEDAVLGIGSADALPPFIQKSTAVSIPSSNPSRLHPLLSAAAAAPGQPSSTKQLEGVGLLAAPSAKPSLPVTAQSGLARAAISSSPEAANVGGKLSLTAKTLISPAERAEKFHLPVSALNEVERKKIRAQKFGIDEKIEDSKASAVATDAVLQKRAARFGLQQATQNVSSEAPTSEALQKRQQRFSANASGTTDTEKKIVKTVSEAEQQLRKRAQRFGVSASEASAMSLDVNVAKGLTAADAERLLKRKMKFSANEIVTDEAKKKRAARFGL